MIVKRIIRRVFLFFIQVYYIVKCELYYLIMKGIGLCNVIEKSPPGINMFLLKFYGAVIGMKCQIDSGITIHRIINKKELAKLSIGNNVYIGHRVILDLTEPIYLADDSALGAGCQVWTHTGTYTNDRTDEKDLRGPVIIEKAAIVYSGSIIGQGVTIGRSAHIGAGSIVIRDIPEKVFAVGAPAKVIKKLN